MNQSQSRQWRGQQKGHRLITSLIALAIAGISPTLQAQIDVSNGLTESAKPSFNQRELEQILAPVALYPDALLAQVLMASTYPLEIVQAARWSRANPDMRGDDAVNAVANKPWDPSVKSLVAFPDLLASMDDDLDHTQDMGDAFLTQKDQVMDTVQFLRRRAKEAGNLASNEQQIITSEAQTIIIQPATPNVVYVPYYNPTIVYGTWWWPTYPPYYYSAPYGYSFASGFAFGTGVAVSSAIFGGFNWGHRNVYINTNRYNTLNYHAPYVYSNVWRHDPSHRRGVTYRNYDDRKRYYGSPNIDRYRDRNDYRGSQGGPARPPRGDDGPNRPGSTHLVRPGTPRPSTRPSSTTIGTPGDSSGPIPFRNEADTRNDQRFNRPSGNIGNTGSANSPIPRQPERPNRIEPQNNPALRPTQPTYSRPSSPSPALGTPGDSSGPIPFRNEVQTRSEPRIERPVSTPAPAPVYRQPERPQSQSNPAPRPTYSRPSTPSPALGSSGDRSGPIPFRNEVRTRSEPRIERPVSAPAPISRPDNSPARIQSAPPPSRSMNEVGGGRSAPAPRSLPGPGDGSGPIPFGGGRNR